MKNSKSNQLIAAGCMVILSAVNIYGSDAAYEGIKASAYGTPVDIESMNFAAYGVNGVWIKDSHYIVEATRDGYQSPVTVKVTFDENGTKIMEIEVVAQAETDGLGSHITDDSFAAQFSSVAAPVRIKDMEIISPGTKEVYGTDVDAQTGATELSDPKEWNPQDQSAEAQATRRMYESGLLNSSIEKRALVTAAADLPVEELSQKKLEETGLSTKAHQVQPAEASTAVTELDGISGATISSKAVGCAVDNAYFFLKENVMN